MAIFSIRNVEGMRQVRMDIRDETVRARKGALSNMRGQIKLVPRLPGPRELIRSTFTDESAIRPYYTGTGTILLEPSIGGYHLLDISKDEKWVLEPGVFMACDGTVALGMKRDSMWQNYLMSETLLSWKTTLSGTGRAAINAPGPVETIEVKNDEFAVQGRLVLGCTAGLRYFTRRPSTFLRSYISGQSRLRVLQGTGKALVCWTPYWNEQLLRHVSGEADSKAV